MYYFYNHTKLCESLEKTSFFLGFGSTSHPNGLVSLKENDVLDLIGPTTNSQHLA